MPSGGVSTPWFSIPAGRSLLEPADFVRFRARVERVIGIGRETVGVARAMAAVCFDLHFKACVAWSV